MADLLEPMTIYFASMASADLREMGTDVTTPRINATVALPDLEIFVDLAGLIDVEAESKRLEKERDRLKNMIAGKEKQLSNDKFVSNAKPEVVQKARDTLVQVQEQLKTVEDAITDLQALN